MASAPLGASGGGQRALAGDKMLVWAKELNELQQFRLSEIRNRIEAHERSWRATPKDEFPELLIEMKKLQVCPALMF